MSLASMLRQRMHVLKSDVARQHGGAHDYLWDVTGPAYACDLQPVETSKRITLLAMEVDASHVVRFNPADVVIGAEDRLKIGTKKYKVVTLEQPEGQRPGWPAKAFIVEVRL